MIRRLLGALQFLTVLPVPGRTASPGEAAVFFPLVGAALGASAGLILKFGGSFGPLFALLWLAVATGCLHEDGLADVADAVRAGRTREKMLAILKDSRIGTYGAIAIVFSFAIRWQALAQAIGLSVAGLAAVGALSRSSMVMVAAWSPAAGTGMGREFVAGCTRGVAAIVFAQAVAIAALASRDLGWSYAAALLMETLVVCLLAKLYFTNRLGGVTGDCLGATCQVAETVCLVLLAWRPSF